MEFVSCDPSNYRAGRTQPVRYIVLHYTANNGDTARNNCDYYHRVGGLQASAHYFCDEYGVMQSVRECDTAWHCGAEAGRRYWHPACRNGNSIGIEMCSRKRADGSYCIKPETVANAAALAREIMQRYGIDTDHVLRHYDVTGKRCPMPWVGGGSGYADAGTPERRGGRTHDTIQQNRRHTRVGAQRCAAAHRPRRTAGQ